MKKTKTAPRRTSRAADPVAATARALLPLYADTEGDSPFSMVGHYPNALAITRALQALIDVMIPGKMSADALTHRELGPFLRRRLSEALRLLRPQLARALPFRWSGQAARTEGGHQPVAVAEEADRVLAAFSARLPAVRQLLIEDIKAAYDGDPAALSYAEVQVAYPGLLAMVSHRLAHELYRLQVPIVPRIMSEWTHSHTGVDIHPGAQIGHGLFIDHATGVVIGETTVIGNRVKIYQGVTLGARSFTLDAQGHPVKHIKRHPTVEDDVVIYANATILGGNTVIGRGSTIGGNVFLMESVPANSMVATIHPELKIKRPHAETADDWVI